LIGDEEVLADDLDAHIAEKPKNHLSRLDHAHPFSLKQITKSVTEKSNASLSSEFCRRRK
jgi:hypothetical protein